MNDFLSSFMVYTLEQLPFVIVTIIGAFTVHEYAHARVAYWLGDDTAARQGRLTLSPLVHMDLLGTIAILLFGFGWARPVPVRVSRLRWKRYGSVLVSLAGPFSNLLLAFGALFIWNAAVRFDMLDMLPEMYTEAAANFVRVFVVINTTLFVFNLLPIPPLDGYRIVEELLPYPYQQKLKSIEPYAFLIILIIVLTPLSHFTIDPLMSTLIPWVNVTMLEWITAIFY
ncbi:MAG: site-2 protease family protein [Bacilli bacterium]